MTPRRVRDDAVSVTTSRASIRDATPEDYDAFAQFFSELHAPEPVPSARVYEEQVAPRAFFAVESGKPSAFLCWRPGSRLDREAVGVASPEGAAFHVSILAVRPERRRRGLGRQLSDEALAGTLRAEGGLVTHRTLRMAGEIPEQA